MNMKIKIKIKMKMKTKVATRPQLINSLIQTSQTALNAPNSLIH
jgi:hypothetical protein